MQEEEDKRRNCMNSSDSLSIGLGTISLTWRRKRQRRPTTYNISTSDVVLVVYASRRSSP
jgi:hypothetical protein